MRFIQASRQGCSVMYVLRTWFLLFQIHRICGVERVCRLPLPYPRKKAGELQLTYRRYSKLRLRQLAPGMFVIGQVLAAWGKSWPLVCTVRIVIILMREREKISGRSWALITHKLPRYILSTIRTTTTSTAYILWVIHIVCGSQRKDIDKTSILPHHVRSH